MSIQDEHLTGRNHLAKSHIMWSVSILTAQGWLKYMFQKSKEGDECLDKQENLLN